MVKWIARWQDLNPKFAELVLRALATIEHDQSVDVCIPGDGGKRSDNMQIALYAQGRKDLIVVNALRKKAGTYPLVEKENSYTVTDCDGVNNKSMHQLGMAVDIVPMENGRPIWPALTDKRWRIIANAMQAQGIRWGGDWNGDGRTRSDGDMSETRVDYPHYEMKVASK